MPESQAERVKNFDLQRALDYALEK